MRQHAGFRLADEIAVRALVHVASEVDSHLLAPAHVHSQVPSAGCRIGAFGAFVFLLGSCSDRSGSGPC